MRIEDILEALGFVTMANHVLFEYNGKPCGIDPVTKEHYDMWCGDNEMVAHSIDEVLDTPFFDGKPLREIAKDVVED